MILYHKLWCYSDFYFVMIFQVMLNFVMIICVMIFWSRCDDTVVMLSSNPVCKQLTYAPVCRINPMKSILAKLRRTENLTVCTHRHPTTRLRTPGQAAGNNLAMTYWHGISWPETHNKQNLHKITMKVTIICKVKIVILKKSFIIKMLWCVSEDLKNSKE